MEAKQKRGGDKTQHHIMFQVSRNTYFVRSRPPLIVARLCPLH